MKPLRDENLAHMCAIAELAIAEGGLVSVSQAQFYDAMNEWWQSMSWDERLEAIDAIASAFRRRAGRTSR